MVAPAEPVAKVVPAELQASAAQQAVHLAWLDRTVSTATVAQLATVVTAVRVLKALREPME